MIAADTGVLPSAATQQKEHGHTRLPRELVGATRLPQVWRGQGRGSHILRMETSLDDNHLHREAVNFLGHLNRII